TETNGTDHINTAETGCTPSFETATSIQSQDNCPLDDGIRTVTSDKRNNAAYSSGSKAADPSVQKGSLNGQANEERSTERITANEINKNFEEKNFEPDSKTDKTYSTKQISLNRHSNISETEAHDVNVNVIGAINNDDSKANGTLSHTSIDAGGVPSRHVQPVTSSLQSSRDKTTETIETYHISTVETGCTPSLGAVTSVQSDGNGQSDNGNGTISSDKRWYEVFTFMSYRLNWNTFLKIYRRLLADTDSKALSYVEADIENTRQEYQSVKETIYRLMNKWKQRNPNGTMQSIVEALDKCGEKLMSEKLMSFINNLTKTG
ncbi:uncharacterized protein LOC132752310, partial [Ruditapes philippinarum]|uniref:uncharacterized protein LOC132752310 n=1 Tax=Ruditapes philippinarum TaxID=129788 RepID=UPI00295B6494